MREAPRPLPLAGSLTLHGLLLGWLVWGLPLVPPAKPKSIYAQVIAPNYPKLVWYTFREKLPDISPAERHGLSMPPVAHELTPDQQIVSKAPEAPRARQMVWEPAPKVELKADLKLPNLLALEKTPQVPAPPPKPKIFVPPPEQPRTPVEAATLETPPQIATANAQQNPLQVEMARPRPRQFVLPENRKAAEASALPDAPQLSASVTGADVQKVVVGLAPAERMEVAPPEGSRGGRFSAGPEVRLKGGDGEPAAGAQIQVPGLMVRGGGAAPARPVLVARASPTSQASLAAALRMATPGLPAPPGALPRSELPPDPSFAGRVIYRLAIQMPNVTSYSGSWTIWLAERDASPGSGNMMRLPEPLHKVDPKYYPSAMDDRVEGKVRLRGVIGVDGHVADVVMVEKLDDRLDQSAQEAMRRWEFSPASRNGRPVAVDMVVEIPFRLRPEKGK